MPLARRMSNSSVASASSMQAFPATIQSTTKVTKEKVGKIMSRRKTRQQAVTEDKENQQGILQSPTPYWKVAKERGGTTTPPQTRSAKKQKKTSEAKQLAFSPSGAGVENEKPSALLVFSPPDQKANARREKDELEKKEKARASRIKKARDSGQLLIFSPTNRDQVPVCPESTQKETSAQEDEGFEHNQNSTPNIYTPENEMASPYNMEVKVPARGSENNLLSSSASHSDIYNEAIARELKNLQETIHTLVDRKTGTNNGTQHPVSLEAQMIRTEKVFRENAKLESEIKLLQHSMKELQAQSSEENKRLIIEKTNLQNELLNASKDVQRYTEALEEMKNQIEIQMKEGKLEREELMNQVTALQSELDEVRERFAESKGMIAALQHELDKAKETLAVEQEKGSRSALETKIHELIATNKELSDHVAKTEEKILLLEHTLLPESEDQLQKALEKLSQFEEKEINLQAGIVEYEKKIKCLEEEVSTLRGEQERERQHFQELNEESSNAYEQMKQDLQQKDDIIADLNEKIKEASASLATKSQKFKETSDELQALQARIGLRNDEIEKLLEETNLKLKESTMEKQLLEEKLAKVLDDVKKTASFKDSILAESDATSAKNKLLQKRIEELKMEVEVSRSECDKANKRVESFNEREEELFRQLQESDRIRRSLHNRVMQLCGNIRVYVRVRPELPGEKDAKLTAKPPPSGSNRKRKHDAMDDDEMVFRFPGIGGNESDVKSSLGADDPTKNLLELTEPKRDRGGLSERRKKWVFGFDNVFTPLHGQEHIWEATEPLVQSAIDGYNVTIFAYGQTGSGKTFTILGEPGVEGIISRSIRKLFEAKKSITELNLSEGKIEISVELLEVYNEKVRDLLAPSNPQGQESLKIKANEAIGSTIIQVSSQEEVEKILKTAQSRRCVKATSSNAVSSRSHMLFTLYFKVHSKDGSSRVGKLNICDLAGSERLGKSHANEDVGGALLQETKHINTSLSVLSNVIEKLQAGEVNVPYRESKLTHLLQNSLGGNSKTLAIVCCNPMLSHFHESLCSLRFAAKVNKVDLKAVANFTA